MLPATTNPLNPQNLLVDGGFWAMGPLDIGCYTCYNMGMIEEAKTPRNIRIRPTILHQARVAAVTQKKTLGQWLEEAIVEKIQREQKLSKEGQ